MFPASQRSSLPWLTHRRLVLIVALLLICVIIEGVYFDSMDYFDKCAMDRFAAGAPKPSGLASTLFRFDVVDLVAKFNFLLMATTSADDAFFSISPDWRSIFIGSFAVLWYASCYLLTVSGHYFFFIFWNIAPFFSAVHHKRDSSLLSNYFNTRLVGKFFRGELRKRTRIFIVARLFLTIAAVYILSDTYRFGFHSPRQIFYGAVASLLCHYLYTLFMEPLSILNKSRERQHHWSQTESRRFLTIVPFFSLAISIVFVKVMACDPCFYPTIWGLPFDEKDIGWLAFNAFIFVLASRHGIAD